MLLFGGHNMDDVTFRRLNSDDINLAMGEEGDFRSGFLCEANVERFLADRMCLILAAIFGQRIIGFAYGYILPRLDGKGDMVYVNEVSVLPEYQRQGIGRELMQGLKRLCAEHKYHRFFLCAERSNTAACGLYHSQGGYAPHGDDVVFHFLTETEV